jgi:putative addiction module component (TIGR02574 family)
MTIAQLTNEALALPLPERIELAQQLWDSIHENAKPSPITADEQAEIERRDAEMDSGNVVGVPHDQAMEMIEQSLRCK